METLQSVWQEFELPKDALSSLHLTDEAQSLPSAFHVGTAAQTSIGLAAATAGLIYRQRAGETQFIEISKHAAELECTGYFEFNGKAINAWEKFSGLYQTSDGHVRIHANFDHHRDGVLALLGLGDADETSKEDVQAALMSWEAEAFEQQASERGLVVAKVRSFEEWDAHPHAHWARTQPLINARQVSAGPICTLNEIGAEERPLTGLRVLDLTRILAGPICGRTLAGYGADVMLVNSPNLPNIANIIDTSRGKRSVHLDLLEEADRGRFRELVRDADVLVQGYRPGGLADLGFSEEELAKLNPNVVCVSLSAYGSDGPWGDRRGFDSLVQTASGFNHAEAQAAGATEPKTMPVPILDYASGFLMAFAAQVGLYRRSTLGGSWAFEVSLLQTAYWLRGMGQRTDGFSVPKFKFKDALRGFRCAHGELMAMPHGAQFSATPVCWQRASVQPGTDKPEW